MTIFGANFSDGEEEPLPKGNFTLCLCSYATVIPKPAEVINLS